MKNVFQKTVVRVLCLMPCWANVAFAYSPCDSAPGSFVRSPDELEQCQIYQEQQREMRELQLQMMKNQLIRQQYDTIQQQSPSSPSPEFQEFIRLNPWYMHDKEMTEYADKLGVELARKGLTALEIYRVVHQTVRTVFPSKF
jgi:hypothetical protein